MGVGNDLEHKAVMRPTTNALRNRTLMLDLSNVECCLIKLAQTKY